MSIISTSSAFSFNIVKSEEAAEDVVSTAFIKIMDNIEKISDLPCPQMTAFCVTIVKNASIDVLRQLQQSVHIDYWDNISDEDTDVLKMNVFTMQMYIG